MLLFFLIAQNLGEMDTKDDTYVAIRICNYHKNTLLMTAIQDSVQKENPSVIKIIQHAVFCTFLYFIPNISLIE